MLKDIYNTTRSHSFHGIAAAFSKKAALLDRGILTGKKLQ